MIKLDKKKSYYLGDLSKEQFSEINELLVNDKEAKWTSVILEDIKNLYLYFSKNAGWCTIEDECNNREATNALELFYTLENVQVDCRELSEEQIKSMCNVYESNGYEIEGCNSSFDDECFLISINQFRNFLCYGFYGDEFKDELLEHTITYDKFMELFSKEEKPTFCEEVKQGYKEKDNKLSYELDFDFVEAMTKRIENEPKYPPYNWKKPMNINDLANALFRHAIEIKKGNLNDNGDLGHLIAVANNAMFMYYQLKNNEQSTK